MKEKIFRSILNLVVICFLLVFSIIVVSAHSGENGNVQVDDVVKEILQKQNIKDIKDLDCNKVSDEDFERLGEAVMSYMHPDEKEHSAMDEMMGGEGSESLRQAHIAMGKRFLGCNNLPGFMGMMHWMMMGRDAYGLKSLDSKSNSKSYKDFERGWMPMMGFGMGSGFALVGLTWFITWLALIIFLILGSIYFYKEIKRDNKKKKD